MVVIHPTAQECKAAVKRRRALRNWQRLSKKEVNKWRAGWRTKKWRVTVRKLFKQRMGKTLRLTQRPPTEKMLEKQKRSAAYKEKRAAAAKRRTDVALRKAARTKLAAEKKAAKLRKASQKAEQKVAKAKKVVTKVKKAVTKAKGKKAVSKAKTVKKTKGKSAKNTKGKSAKRPKNTKGKSAPNEEDLKVIPITEAWKKKASVEAKNTTSSTKYVDKGLGLFRLIFKQNGYHAPTLKEVYGKVKPNLMNKKKLYFYMKYGALPFVKNTLNATL